MEFRLLRRPLCDLLSRSNLSITPFNLVTKRHEATARRLKKKLNIKPESSFIFPGKETIPDRIVFNPPSSVSSPLHTPYLFLPKDDPRRQLNSTAVPSGSPLPPPIRPLDKFQRNHLKEQDIEDMRRLRKNDPENWTIKKLAKKYNCSWRFVQMSCDLPQRQEFEKAKLEAIKSRWGPKRRMAREDRVKRKEAIKRDE